MDFHPGGLFVLFSFLKNNISFIYLAESGLSCSMWNLCGVRALWCSKWSLESVGSVALWHVGS